MARQKLWRVFVCVVITALTGLPLAACTASDQAAVATAAAEAAKTVEVAARTRIAAEAQTAVVAAGTQAVQAGKTAVAAAQTQAAQAAQTVLASGGNAAQTQVAAIKTKLAGTPSAVAPAMTPLPGAFSATYQAPYEACDTQSNHTASPPSGSWELLEKGFSNALATCDADRGAINAGVLVFGSKGGNILKAPDQEANASGQMRLTVTPSFTGKLRIEARVVVSANMGAAAGSAMVLPDFEGVLKDVFITDEIIGAFLDIAQGLILGTASGAKGEAYLVAEIGGQKQEKRVIVGEHGVGASFPIPPWHQDRTLDNESAVLALEVPVQKGQPVQIAVGVAAQALTKGWATAYWNPWKKHQAVVTRIVVTEQ